ncbi:MAG: hypothetical protein ACK551_01095 [Vampirovibrionales bacterium]
MLPIANRVPAFVKAPSALPASSQRQGWAWETHDLMIEALPNLLPPDLAQFISEHLPILKAGTRIADGKAGLPQHKDLFEKSELRGPNHYVNLEAMLTDYMKHNPTLPAFFELKDDHKGWLAQYWKHFWKIERDACIDKGLSSASLEFALNYFDQQPLTPERLEADPNRNIFKSVFHFHQRIIEQMQAIKAQEKKTGSASKKKLVELAFLLGVGSHFDQDWRNPLHTSIFHKWDLGFGIKANSHKFFEYAQSTKQEQAWLGDMNANASTLRAKIQPKSQEWLKSAMAERLQYSFLNLFDLAYADRCLRAEHSKGQTYKDALKAAWTSEKFMPLWMRQATMFTAMMFHSAYEEAGKPHLLGKDALERQTLLPIITE